MKKKKIKDKIKMLRSLIEYGLLRCLITIARPLPAALVRTSAQWLFGVVQFRKKLAGRNLKHVFPELPAAESKRIIREMYKNLALTGVESYLQKPSEVFSRMEKAGWEKVEKVLAKGKGVIIASGHLGNFEMGGRLMGHSAPVLVVVKRQHNRYFDEYANKLRLSDNCFPIQAGGALRPILKILRQNGIVVIMTDQNARGQGYRLNFLGKPASTHISAAKIAIKTGVPVIIAGVTRTQAGYPLMHFCDPIEVSEYQDDLNGYLQLMQRIQDEFGELVKKYPEHWFWVHRRWRRPEKAKFSLIEE